MKGITFPNLQLFCFFFFFMLLIFVFKTLRLQIPAPKSTGFKQISWRSWFPFLLEILKQCFTSKPLRKVFSEWNFFANNKYICAKCLSEWKTEQSCWLQINSVEVIVNLLIRVKANNRLPFFSSEGYYCLSLLITVLFWWFLSYSLMKYQYCKS